MREFTLESIAELAQKLRESSKKEVDRLNSKHGGIHQVPGYIRLKMTAASAIDHLISTCTQAQTEKEAAIRDLASAADCSTCKCGPRKSCSLKSECGEDRTLWSWRGVPKV